MSNRGLVVAILVSGVLGIGGGFVAARMSAPNTSEINASVDVERINEIASRHDDFDRVLTSLFEEVNVLQSQLDREKSITSDQAAEWSDLEQRLQRLEKNRQEPGAVEGQQPAVEEVARFLVENHLEELRGPAGPQGATGQMGPRGLAGARGPAGPTGPMGPEGRPGKAATISAPGTDSPVNGIVQSGKCYDISGKESMKNIAFESGGKICVGRKEIARVSISSSAYNQVYFFTKDTFGHTTKKLYARQRFAIGESGYYFSLVSTDINKRTFVGSIYGG
jgi:hypothetical protein